jgi:Protein of unknown function (DUF1552)
MNRRYFSRRSFLAASGLGAAMLPLMPTFGRAAGAAPIRRFIAIGVPNGHTDKWLPVGGESNWTINPDADSPLKPLERHKARVNVLGGLWLKNGWDTTYVVANHDPRNFKPGSIGGHAAPPVLLTGAVGKPGPAQFDGWEMTAGGMSVDTHIATTQPGADGVKFKPLALRATRRESASSYISFKGAPVTPGVQNTSGVHDDPVALFKDMFGDGTLNQDEMARVIAGKKHILDFTKGHLTEMRQRFGAQNQARIDAHLEAVAKAAESVAIVASCKTPAAPDPSVKYLDGDHNPQYNGIIKAQIDLAVVAMACDLTRSASMLWSDGANDNISFPWLKDKNGEFAGQAPAGELGAGEIRSHHNLAHHNTGELKNYSDQWFIEQYAYLMDRLAEATDADGRPLIETTVVLYCNMQRSGGGHQTQDLFWLMGGNYDNYFKTGRYLRWPSGKDGTSIPQNQILTSIINGAGCPHLEFFGDAQYGGELGLLRG